MSMGPPILAASPPWPVASETAALRAAMPNSVGIKCWKRQAPVITSKSVSMRYVGEGNDQLGRRTALLKLAILPAAFVVGAGWGTGLALASEDKLSIEQVKDRIVSDIIEGQYYVTGNLSRSIYDENCRFTDPTTVVTGVDKYVAAIQFLFDPSESLHELLAIEVSSPRTIDARWRLRGYLKFPWRPYISPYEGTTRYTVNDQGLIALHDETWDISVWTAFQQFLTPSWKGN